MGNSASQQRRTDQNAHLTDSPTRRGRSPSPVPGPGHPHSSMRTKRRSLELPDFNRGLAMTSGTANGSSSGLGSRTRAKTPPKSQAINIPKAAVEVPLTRRPNNNFSSSELIVPATHLPFPPNQAQQRTASSTYAGTGGVRGQRSRAGRPQRMSQMYEEEPQTPPPHQQYHSDPQDPATPPSPPPFEREIVNSTIPIGLFTDLDALVSGDGEEDEETPVLLQGADIDDSTLVEYTPVEITWQGGGKEVVLARAGDDDWNGRQLMDQDPNTNTWTTTIYLLPGTHHVRFLVDDQWRVSDELPTAVDDSGSLANYVSVQPGSPPTTTTAPPPAPAPNTQSHVPAPARQPVPGQSFWSTASSVDDDDTNRPSTHSLHVQISSAKWTSELPPALIEAAREEESYLQASAGRYDAQSRSTHVSGFVPAPNIPPAPGMPRQLDKLILNTKMTVPGSASNNGNNGSGSGQGSPSRVGSGQGGRGENRGERDRERDSRSRREGRERKRESRREEKREREQRREREREQREQQQQQQASRTGVDVPVNPSLANFPPAPPPSEDGSGTGLDEKPEQSPVRGGATAGVEGNGESRAAQGESGNTTAKTTPEPVSEVTTTPETTSTTVPSTATVSVTSPTPPSATTNKPTTTTTAAPGTGAISGSRAITLDMENMPALTDDNSVLPVPSHVVIQHLCTSAIRNGVLAVASTTRYRKKYMTTVYYKPTA